MRKGRNLDFEELPCNLTLKKGARLILRTPKGLIVRELPEEVLKGKKIFAVGDLVLRNLLNAGIKPELCVIDLKIQRKNVELPKKGLEDYEVFKARNPPGFLTSDAWRTIRKAIEVVKMGKKALVIIDGEEDLLGFPVVILGPLGSILIYGQPGEGAVIVEITNAEKERAIKLLKNSFKPANET